VRPAPGGCVREYAEQIDDALVTIGRCGKKDEGGLAL
jgi:hypothetical protein